MASPIIFSDSKFLTAGQRACVEILQQALDEASAGKIYTVGIVACYDRGFAAGMAGLHAAELNLGCDNLKKKILESIEEAEQSPKKKSLESFEEEDR